MTEQYTVIPRCPALALGRIFDNSDRFRLPKLKRFTASTPVSRILVKPDKKVQPEVSALTRDYCTTKQTSLIECRSVLLFLAITSILSPGVVFNFRYLQKDFLDQSIQTIFYFILKTEALVQMEHLIGTQQRIPLGMTIHMI